MVDREDSGGYHQEEDEMINDKEEAKADAAALAVFPKRMKAILKFGYDEGFKDHLAAKGETFEGYIESVFNMMQVYWRHPSLTTEVIFEVAGCFYIINSSWDFILFLPYVFILNQMFFLLYL